MKDYLANNSTQLSAPSLNNNKKSRSLNSKHKSPSKTRTLVTTWKETNKSEPITIPSTHDIDMEKKHSQQQFQASSAPSATTLEALLEEEILITPETLLSAATASKLATPSVPTSEILPEEVPTKDNTPDILALLAKKDTLKKISDSVQQGIQSIPTTTPIYSSTITTTTTTTTASTKTISPTPSPKAKQFNSTTSTSSSKNKSPPRAPSPPTKQPAMKKNNNNTSTLSSNNNSRNPSPTKSPSKSHSFNGNTTSINNSNTTANNNNITELRFAGPAFHNSPAASDLPIPSSDFFAAKPAKTQQLTVTAVIPSHSPPTKDTNASPLTTHENSSSLRINFAKELPEFQVVPPHHPQMMMAPPHHPMPMVGAWPMMMTPQVPPMNMMPPAILAPQQPPVMLDQMSSQLKMMLKINS